MDKNIKDVLFFIDQAIDKIEYITPYKNINKAKEKLIEAKFWITDLNLHKEIINKKP